MAIVTKKVLADSLAEVCGTKAKALEVVNCLFENVTESLKNGDTVDIFGFGKFEVRDRAERQGINPKTGEKLVIAATKSPAFKASKSLKDSVK